MLDVKVGMIRRFIFIIALNFGAFWGSPARSADTAGAALPAGLSGFATRFSNGAFFVSDEKKNRHTYVSVAGEQTVLFEGTVDTTWDNMAFNHSKMHQSAFTFFAESPKLVFIESGPKMFLITEGGKIVQFVDDMSGLKHSKSASGKSVWKIQTPDSLLIANHEFRLLQFEYEGRDFGPSFLLRSDGRFLKLGDLPKDASLEEKGGTIVISNGGPRINPYTFSVQKSRVDPRSRKVVVLTDKNESIDARSLVYQSFRPLHESIFLEPTPSVDEEDLEKIRRALAKKQVGSAMITGEAGEGKSTLLKAFVKNVAQGLYPEISATTEFILVDSTSMGQGTRYTGAYQSKLKALLDYARDAHVILVLDEAHSLKGSGTHENDPSDFFEQLKPHLADGSIRIIGTTTTDFYQEWFASDPALARRLPEVKKKPTDPRRVPEFLGDWADLMGYPRLAEKVRRHIAHIADEFDSAGSLLSKAIRLQEEIFLELTFKELPIDVVDEAFVNSVSAQLYSVDKAQLVLKNVEEKFSRLQRQLEKISGYDEFKAKLFSSTLRFLTRTGDLSKPNGRYFLTGPKGTGKTFFARTFAEGMEYPFERIDLSQYQTPYDVKDLLDKIAAALAKNPFTVFLIDEIEKSPRRIQNALLSVLDSDHIKARGALGGRSRTGLPVRFKTNNATFFLASNAGREFILQSVAQGGGAGNPMDMALLREKMIEGGVSEFLIDRCTVVPVFPARDESEFKRALGLNFATIVQRLAVQTAREIKIKEGAEDRLTTKIARIFFRPGASYREALEHLDEEVGNAAARAVLREMRLKTEESASSHCEALLLDFE